ncbi:siderophore-interacting protein [Nonomuraea insulae]|uniref:Siderophore-interacting protein n=1 Tax=Nonomuraea insulae TaxID=1616787 RepID=A0ABW1CKJ2_9ACTN
MARGNLNSTRIKPRTSELLILRVLRRERLSPHFARVTLGGGDAKSFVPMGYDQWFRLFLPVSEDSLTRLPPKLTTLSYAKYLTISKASRPVLRNYSVRAYRPEGPEIDVDFVLHGSAADGTAGPAAAWAETCEPDDSVAIIDEGIGFNPPPETRRVVLAADESGLPALAGILASLPPGTRGHAFAEVPSPEDRLPLDVPEGVELTWIVREGPAAAPAAVPAPVPATAPAPVPGAGVLDAARALPLSGEPFYGWVVGESALPAALRRHWVRGGVPKEHIIFCGYWRRR